MEDDAIYRKTEKGRREVADHSLGLDSHLRRLLIMIDGQRGVAELSVYVRAGDLESAFARLLDEGFVEVVDADPGRVAYVPAANDPVVFAGIKIRAMTEIRSRVRGRLGPIGEMVVAEINDCHTPLALREKLRTLEKSLAQLAGAAQAVELARSIGSELTRLMPKK